MENGEHGPPSDEVIAALAETLEADVDELLKLAGRAIGGASFERQMLAELARLRREMHAGFERLAAAIAER